MFPSSYFPRAYFPAAYFAGSLAVVVVPPVVIPPPVVVPVVTLRTITVRDLITASLQELNVFDASTAIDPDNARYALDRLNDYIDAMATEGLMVHRVIRVTWPITTAASYTIGPGAQINIGRPVSSQDIEAIGYIDTSTGPPYQERLVTLLSVSEYASWTQKTDTSTQPSAFYYDATFGVTGFGTISPFPVPTGTTLLGVIYVPSAINTFESLNDLVSLPPGYRRMLRTNLALEIAGAYGAQIPPGLEKRAQEARANVKRANIRTEEMRGMYGGHYNIFTDQNE